MRDIFSILSRYCCTKASSFDFNVMMVRLGKIIFCSVVGAIFLTAFIMRFILYNVPFSGPDTIGYIGVAFQYLDKGLFSAIAERSYPYPLFLTIILSSFKDVSAITAIQHALGLMSGLFFLIIWFMADSIFLKLSGASRYFYWLVGIVGLYVLLCSDWSVYIEHYAHPEALTSFLITSIVLLHLNLYKLCAGKSSFASIVLCAIVAFLMNYLIFKYQPRYGLSLIFVFCVFCVILFVSLNIKKSITIIILAIAVTYLLLFLPFSGFAHKGPLMANRSAALFFHNLKIISPIIKNDLVNKKLGKKEKMLLESILVDLKKAEDPNNNYATGYSKSLGLNTDYFDRTYYKVLESKGSFYAAANFYISYIKRAIVKYPFLLISKVIKEFLSFYSDGIMFGRWQANSRSVWVSSYGVIKGFKPHFSNTDVLDRYINSLKFISSHSVHHSCFDSIYSSVVSIEIAAKKLLPVITVLFLVLFAVSLKCRDKYCGFGVFVFTLMGIQFGFNVTISIANTNAVIRYLYDQLSLIILFEAFALVFVSFCVVHWFSRLYHVSDSLFPVTT